MKPTAQVVELLARLNMLLLAADNYQLQLVDSRFNATVRCVICAGENHREIEQQESDFWVKSIGASAYVI